ncbi:beta-glucoside-specific PTS transporter subunit IIABC [Peribacillus muralis]|uniref:beta-glucoside-specific PTS transporter subunit IIABC n=1 Tax=Peribacillus muralis TaxID=264697 RepID=UPI00070D74C4|nr:beta-glucoside-specific PTS transporter subunit IIABC [Peribacillus muralis]
MDNKQLGNRIVQLVGGEENINSLVHCATRLRFKLNDRQKADKEGLRNIPDVLTVVEKGGQLQVVIGNKVGKVYTEIMNDNHIHNEDSATENENNEKVGVMAKSFEYISGTFSPLMPALAGAGMIKALLAILNILNLIDINGTTYAVLNAASSGVFYFLPIFVAISAAKKLNANPFVGGAIAAGLIDPNFTALLNADGQVSFMNIPLIVTDYSSTVFPLLIAMAVYAPLERFVKKRTPDTIQLFFVPMVGILVMVPLTALVFGPFAQYISLAIGAAVTYLVAKSAILTGIIIACIWPILVILGVHWGVVPIMIDNFSRGGDIIGPITAASTFAQMGIAFGIFLRARKNKELRSLSFAATLSGLFAGVTEPILYGIILRYKKFLPLLLIAGSIGGAIVATFNVRLFGFAFNSLLTIPAYSPTIGYIFGIGASFLTATILAFIFGTEGKKQATADKAEKATEDKSSQTVAVPDKIYELSAPLKGELIPLENVDDAVFSSGAMGKGVAIEPAEGIVSSPFDGKIVTLFPTKHAIGLISEDGVEVLIHIGLDTVQLGGKYFDAHVEAGSAVKKGDKLVTFDIKSITEAGYKTTTPVIITNTAEYLDVVPTKSRPVTLEETILTIVK